MSSRHPLPGRRGNVARPASVLALLLIWGCEKDESFLTGPAFSASADRLAPLYAPDEASQVPGRYIVIVEDEVADVMSESAAALAREAGGELVRVYDVGLRGFVVQLPTNDAVHTLRALQGVRYIEQDGIGLPHDTQYNAPWSLDRVDQSYRPISGTYEYDYDGSGVNLYIIDSGVETTDSDLTPRASGWWTFSSSYPPNDDCLGHGTRVASVAAGTVYGIAKEANIFSLRIDDCSSGAFNSDIVAAINQVAAYHTPPAVANLSYSGDAVSIKNAIETAIGAGVIFSKSAGNDTVSACTDEATLALGLVVVAASDSNDARPTWSNYGSCVTLFAPGVAVPTTDGVRSGTSYSAPMYAGAAALHLERWPTDSPAKVRGAVVGSSTQGVIGGTLGSPNLLLYTRGPRLTVTWDGPIGVHPDDFCRWDALPLGGRTPYTYAWSGLLSGSSSSVLGNGGSTALLTLEVWDADGRYGSYFDFVIVDSGNPMACPE